MPDAVSKFLERKNKVGGSLISLGASANGTRNSNNVHRRRRTLIPRLKKEKDSITIVLVPMDLELFCNPLKGYDDDIFNDSHPWRPDLTWSQAVLELKKYFFGEVTEVPEGMTKEEFLEEREEAKQNLIDFQEVDEWVCAPDEIDKITDSDRNMFRKGRTPRIYTFSSIDVKTPSLNSGNTLSYRTTFKRDENMDPYVIDPSTGEKVILSGDKYPMELQIADLFYTWASAQYKEYEKANPKMTDKDKKEKWTSFMSKSPITRDKPSNQVVLVNAPLVDGPRGLAIDLPDADKFDAAKAHKLICFSKYAQNLEVQLNNVFTKYKHTDVMDDFIAVMITVGSEEDPMERGLKTQYATPNLAEPIHTLPGSDHFVKMCSEAIRNIGELGLDQEGKPKKNAVHSEIVVQNCAARNEMNNSILASVAEAIASDISAAEVLRWLTPSDINKYAAALSLIYSDSVTKAILEAKQSLKGVTNVVDASDTDLSGVLGGTTETEASVPAPAESPVDNGVDVVGSLDED